MKDRFPEVYGLGKCSLDHIGMIRRLSPGGQQVRIHRLSDYFIASSAFARSLVGEVRPGGGLSGKAALGPGLVGVTSGKEGYLSRDRGRLSVARPIRWQRWTPPEAEMCSMPGLYTD